MACFTLATVTLDNTEDNRKARAELGLPAEGRLTRTQAQQVKMRAAAIKAVRETRALMRARGQQARIIRKGESITVTVQQ